MDYGTGYSSNSGFSSNGGYANGGYDTGGSHSGSSGQNYFDIFSMMNSCLGTAATHAQVAATAANLESTLMFTKTARVFAVLDIASNVLEIFDDQASANQKFEDGAQAVLGIALIFGGPVTAVVGGAILLGWEVYEYNRDQ